jgi:CheY-like chemotaxis protein
MLTQPKILLLDDDQDFLELYREMLVQQLSCMPDVRTAASGARALALLESEPFHLLIVDLNLPKMDGLQVLSIARRKYPEVRLVILTGIRDEQFRARAYAMGVDQYWIKPESDQEMGLFMESMESLLNREASGGFRGIQSKSLVDIVQLECLSQSSTVLKITNGLAEGKIWIQNGEVTHAEAPGMTAEAAFEKILTWKTGNFENMPADMAQPRTIFTSYQGLLLNTAQAQDEAASLDKPAEGPAAAEAASSAPKLAELSQMNGVEFVLALGSQKNSVQDSWGLENPKPVAEWVRKTLHNFNSLGERLQVGEVQQVIATHPQRKIALAHAGEGELCVGFSPQSTGEELGETMKRILTKWAS